MRRAISIASVAAATIAAMLLACSNDDGRTAFEGEEAGAGSGDSGSGDGGTDAEIPDARGAFDPADEAVSCEAMPCVTQLAAGARHFCARFSDGTVRCWGDDARGQLGVAADAGTDAGPVSQISAAAETSCARRDDGAVHCWGGNKRGELGQGTADEDRHPRAERVPLERAAARVDVGHGSVCATASDGKVTCWGSNESAQLARGAPSEPGAAPEAPAPAELGAPVKRTSAGTATAFAMTDDGTLLSWGALDGPSGTLGGRTSSVAITPATAPVDGLGRVSSFAVSGETPALDIPPFGGPPPPSQHACAVSDGEVYCWGKSERGAFGSGLSDVLVPLPRYARLGTRAYAQQVAVGGESTCVRMTDGEVRCAGANDRGQLGTGARGPRSLTFVKATSLVGRAVHVALANETACALLQGGTVQCWGGNERGELGQGTRDDEAHPATKVAFQ